MRKTKLAYVLVATLIGGSATAGGGGITGGATEMTQILNNVQLLDISVKEAIQVADGVQRRILLAQQYVTMLQNLKNLPQATIDQAIAPYRQQVEMLGGVRNTVMGLKQAAENARSLFDQRLRDASAMNMNVADYMQYEASLATQRGGVYRQRLQQDISAIDQLQARASALRQAASQIGQISGNIEGLQLLAQHASISAGELLEIKGALLAQSADRNAQSALNQEAQAEKSNLLARTLNEAKTQKEQRGAQSLPESNPWGRTWPGITP